MALEMWINNDKKTPNGRGLAAAALFLSIWSGEASALEIQSTVSKVDDAGKIEITLPAGAIVSVGDKVRIEVVLPGVEPEAIKTRWTVKDIEGQTILASPDGEPTSAPKVGFGVVINTAAVQKTPIETPVEAKQPAMKAEMPKVVVEPTPELAETDKSQPPKVEISSLDNRDQAETETAPKLEANSAPISEAVETTVLPKASEPVEPVAADEANASKEETAVSAELRGPVVTYPAPEHECDQIAAHPFDPDAVVKGLDYKRLNAAQIISVCNEAIAEYPKEARFYTQLTRGLHKADKLDKAFDATMRGAELGSAHSMAFLGVMYKLGESVSKDLEQSLSWFEKAAEKGNPGGMVFAAAMYRDGTGTPQDYKRAAQLYQKASDMDVAEAMSSLAIFYDRGQGVEKAPDKAASYLLKALLGDDKQAQQLLFEAPGAISQETRKLVQTILKNEGFYKSKIDGDFGSRTREALTRYRSGRKTSQ